MLKLAKLGLQERLLKKIFIMSWALPNLRITLRKIHSPYRFVLCLRGRIAQLVELLFYTQAVIGSSPVAPILFKDFKHFLCESSSIG